MQLHTKIKIVVNYFCLLNSLANCLAYECSNFASLTGTDSGGKGTAKAAGKCFSMTALLDHSMTVSKDAVLDLVVVCWKLSGPWLSSALPTSCVHV